MFFLLRNQFILIGRLLKEPATAIVAVIFLLVLALVFAVEFIGFREGFKYLLNQEYFGNAITLYILEAFLLLAFILTLISSIILASGIFFYSSELKFIFTTPTSVKRIFTWRLILLFLLSSWPLLLIALPGILALGITHKASLGFYLLNITALFLFLILTSSIAALISFFVARVSQIRASYFISIALSLGAILSGWVVARILVPQNISNIFNAVDLTKIQAPLDQVEKAFLPFPSHLLAKLAFHSATNTQNVFLIFLLVLLVSLGVLFATFVVSNMFYRPLFIKGQEGAFIARSVDATINKIKRWPFPLILKGKIGVIIEKDIRSIVRNKRDIANIGFFILLASIYLFLLSGLAQQASEGYKDKLSVLLALHFGGLGYFITTISLRFLFPLIGREGQSAWILASMPVSPKKMLFAKLLFGAILLTVLMVSGLYITLPYFNISLPVTINILILGIVTSIFIAIFQISMGAISPELRKRDPERMSTTPMGLITTFISLIYIGIMTLLAMSTNNAFSNLYIIETIYAFASALIAIVSIKLALKKMRYLDF